MAGSPTVAWTERMELLKDSVQQRVLRAPLPPAAMERLLQDGKAKMLGRFQGSPVHYLDRWWRYQPDQWVALDDTASAQLDRHAERYRAAIAATTPDDAPAASPAPDRRPHTRTEVGDE